MSRGRKYIFPLLVVAVLATADDSRAYTGSATAYHWCDGSTTMTASGRTASVGVVANNWLRLGTWIQMQQPKTVMGRRFFRVLDRGGPGFALDFWAFSCGWMNRWGRRTVTFRVVPRRELWRGRPKFGWSLNPRTGKRVWRP